MFISIWKPENVKSLDNYQFIHHKNNSSINDILGFPNKSKILGNMDGLLFFEDSHLANTLNNSGQLKDAFDEAFKSGIKNNRFSVTLDDDKNIAYAINGATIINPRIENGYYTAYLFDIYDFKFTNKTYSEFMSFANDSALLLQLTGILEKYYVIVPIKIKI